MRKLLLAISLGWPIAVKTWDASVVLLLQALPEAELCTRRREPPRWETGQGKIAEPGCAGARGAIDVQFGRACRNSFSAVARMLLAVAA